jgi:hypothetical protein
MIQPVSPILATATLPGGPAIGCKIDAPCGHAIIFPDDVLDAVERENKPVVCTTTCTVGKPCPAFMVLLTAAGPSIWTSGRAGNLMQTCLDVKGCEPHTFTGRNCFTFDYIPAIDAALAAKG